MIAGVGTKTLTIGSRGSKLALWQANHIASRLNTLGFPSRIQIIKTTGDHLQTASLVQAGGKGLFTKEIEEALLDGSIDLAVHSLKDLPTEMTSGLTIAAVPEREDVRDALVGSRLDELPRGARVGTSSGRRAAQLLRLRPDLEIQPVRGNVDTRIHKIKSGQYAAIMLAAAGLRRLGLEREIGQLFSPEEICPAAGQGALAIQTRQADEVEEACAVLNNASASRAVTCERAILAALGGGCQLPVGAYAEVSDEKLSAFAVVTSPDGKHYISTKKCGPVINPVELAQTVAEDLLHQGAQALLAQTH